MGPWVGLRFVEGYNFFSRAGKDEEADALLVKGSYLIGLVPAAKIYQKIFMMSNSIQ